MTTTKRRRGVPGRRALIALTTTLALVASTLHATAARADEPIPADRSRVVTAWRMGAPQVRAAAQAALVGTDDDVRAFLQTGWEQAERLDERDAVVATIGQAGPAVRAAAQRALTAADAGNPDAISTFLATGWRTAADVDTRVSVNQLVTTGGPRVKTAAQQVLNGGSPAALREFLDSGWHQHWALDQRIRVVQAINTGGPTVRASAQKALNTGTPEALEQFLEYGWAVASARDDEVATLTELLAQAQAAADEVARETQTAKDEAARAKEAAAAAERAAAAAAAATEAARENTEQAAAFARRAAVAAEKATEAARVAVEAAAAASRAARAAATAAGRAAAAATKARQAAAEAQRAAAGAYLDRNTAGNARAVAEYANRIAQETRDFAVRADQAGKALEAGRAAIDAAYSAADNARRAAAANDEAVRHATAAGADAREAIRAAARARANADRATRAARAAEGYLAEAIVAAYGARDAAYRAADNAEAAARAAVEAANWSGTAAEAARKAATSAEAAAVAAQAAVDTAGQAAEVFETARQADAERLAVTREEGTEAARIAYEIYAAQQSAADFDSEQAAQRDAETTRLLGVARDASTPPAEAVAAGRRAALNLTRSGGTWTQQAAMNTLAGTGEEVLVFVRDGLAVAAAQDDRQAVMALGVTDNTALRTAATTALEGTDEQIRQFLRNQDYPGRATQDRIKVVQIKAAAQAAGDQVTAQKANEALQNGTLEVLREFIESGQYAAAAVGERVRVNQVLADPDSGPEVRTAAQIALESPPAALREFLDTGRYTAAERDYESAAHLAVVGGLLQRINETAETAVRLALEAQAAAAEANGDAQRAAAYAEQAAASAEKAAGYATQAQNYANQATQSVDRAATAVQTARNAATRANASARSAVKSAAWAVSSFEIAKRAATEANAAATQAYDSAVAAGQDALAAAQAGLAAYKAYENMKGAKIIQCMRDYAEGPNADLEKALYGTQNNWAKNCIEGVVDPQSVVKRAYANAGFCGYFPQDSQFYQNCINSTFDPAFSGIVVLDFLAEMIKAVAVSMIPAGVLAGVACIATVVCGAVAGTLLTFADVGLNIYKLINGDQSLAQTLLNLGRTALESLVLLGLGKLAAAGFQAIKAVYNAVRAARAAQRELEAANMLRLVRLQLTCGLRGLSSVTMRAAASCWTPQDLGGGWFISPAGLHYGPLPDGDTSGDLHRFMHVLRHTFPDPNDPAQTVFLLGPDESVFALIDEAWLLRSGGPIREAGIYQTWRIDMGRVIGTRGERAICIGVARFDELITAFPARSPDCR